MWLVLILRTTSQDPTPSRIITTKSHAAAIDVIAKLDLDDCSMHCFHYQQMFEMLLKFLLETKSKYGAYPHTHKLNKLLEQLIELTNFRTDKNKYFMALQVITVYAEEYRFTRED